MSMFYTKEVHFAIPGATKDDFLVHLHMVSKSSGTVVQGIFNDNLITVRPKDSISDLFKRYM